MSLGIAEIDEDQELIDVRNDRTMSIEALSLLNGIVSGEIKNKAVVEGEYQDREISVEERNYLLDQFAIAERLRNEMKMKFGQLKFILSLDETDAIELAVQQEGVEGIQKQIGEVTVRPLTGAEYATLIQRN